MVLELWRRIPDFPNYQISSLGRVRIMHSIHKRFSNGYIMKIKPIEHKYLEVKLRNKGVTRKFPVHRLVLSAFRGPKPPGLVSRHLDTNRLNNCLDNLCYGTQAENYRDGVRCGKKSGWPKGRMMTDEHKEKNRLGNLGRIGPNLGRKFSLESRMKMSASQTGRNHSLETRRKIGERRRGHPVSPETKAKLSISNTLAWKRLKELE